MAICFFLLCIASVVSSARAEVSASDYVFWKKADITAWHQYFPSRALEEERLTNRKAVEATQNLTDGMHDSLSLVAQYQAQELQTAQLMMEGTSAQGCISGIAHYMDNAILQAITNFSDCTADVLPRLQRQYSSWVNTNSTYQAAYQRVLAGIDRCATTYPNKDSLSRLKSCVQSWNNNYLTAASSLRSSVFTSPAMNTFLYTVATCADTAAQQVVAKGWAFLSKLVSCAKLSENVDSEYYEAQVSSGFNSYITNSKVRDQSQQAQGVHNAQVGQVEQEMLRYYELQKRALEQYVIESRGQGHYSGQISWYLQNYFNTVSAAALDHPASTGCTTAATAALSLLVNTGSAAALFCDQKVVSHTKQLLAEVNKEFSVVNAELPSRGNVAILSCCGQGYIFAEQTILRCFTLSSSELAADLADARDSIVDDVATLQGYENTFFNSSSLPCQDTILRRVFLGGQRVLYDLQRCLYITSGAKYDVTVPSLLETTTRFTTPDVYEL